MKFQKMIATFLVLTLLFGCSGCRAKEQSSAWESAGEQWKVGFAQREILPDETSEQPLYMGGYNSGMEIEGVLDYCQARAAWIQAGEQGILLIGIDSVALDHGTVDKIRNRLSDVAAYADINVYSTHSHASADTLGLWGPIGIDGKNQDYMDALVRAAEQAGREAIANPKEGNLYFGQVQTQEMLRDSRDPQVYDENLYQIRFNPKEGSGLRLLFYGAHAESLRSQNTLLSRDFAGALCDKVTEATGDQAMFCPGAIGGLIMTREFSSVEINPAKNMEITAQKLAEYALSISPESEQKLEPKMKFSRTTFVVPMDNPVFLLYRFLGIFHSKAVAAQSATGYGVETELSVLMLDKIGITLVPGEIFPELVFGGADTRVNPDVPNPKTLKEIAEANGVEMLLILGLANDEIGYIVPPSDFLVSKIAPYLERQWDQKSEDHYEETNSVGPLCAEKIAEAFEKALAKLQ